MTKVTKGEMERFVRHQLSTNSQWAMAALLRVFENQTIDEQKAHDTRYHNDIGFTSADARWLSSLATQLKSRGFLSPKQMAVLFRKISKYAGQIARASNQEKLAFQTLKARGTY